MRLFSGCPGESVDILFCCCTLLLLLLHECLPVCCCGGVEGVEEEEVVVAAAAAVLCCEEPLLGTNPPTGASVWACAVSLLAARGGEGPALRGSKRTFD